MTKPITMVDDPFGFKTNEIIDAQNSNEPLDLDEPMDIAEIPEITQNEIANAGSVEETVAPTVVPTVVQGEVMVESAMDALVEASLSARSAREHAQSQSSLEKPLEVIAEMTASAIELPVEAPVEAPAEKTEELPVLEAAPITTPASLNETPVIEMSPSELSTDMSAFVVQEIAQTEATSIETASAEAAPMELAPVETAPIEAVVASEIEALVEASFAEPLTPAPSEPVDPVIEEGLEPIAAMTAAPENLENTETLTAPEEQMEQAPLEEAPITLESLNLAAAEFAPEEFKDEFKDEFKVDENPEQLERLAEVLSQVQEEAHQEALNSVTEDTALDEATRLAAEIAEDQALTEALALEAEAAEENDEQLQEALPDAPQVNESGELDLREMESCVEALLFMTDKPLSGEKLRELLGPEFSPAVFQEAITSLCDRYKGPQFGIEVVEIGGGYQFRTKPNRAALAKKLARISAQRLSSGAMQSLAIVAYKQPVMKEEIDKIRGVDSSYFIRGLLDRKLIQISGRSDLPGRPMLYTTTQEFLEIFGLKDLSAMPALHEIEGMIPNSESTNPDDDDPRVKEMRKLVSQMKADTSTSLVYNPREDEKILKEIREKVSAIPTSTPFLDEQKEKEKLAALEAKGLLPKAAQAANEPQLVLAAVEPAPAEELRATKIETAPMDVMDGMGSLPGQEPQETPEEMSHIDVAALAQEMVADSAAEMTSPEQNEQPV